MAVYSFRTVQKIPLSLQQTWDFFSSPVNLSSITPAGMNFRIISGHPGKKMYPGQIIEYRVSPFLGISMYWMTEITQVRDHDYFVDEQRKGPYRMWHHQHHFKKIDGGVEMTDIIHYQLPLGWVGQLANLLFVEKQLKKIFEYRYQKVEELFGQWD